MSNGGNRLEGAEYEELEHMASGLSRLKKIHMTIVYLIWVIAPVLTVDLVRLAKTGKWLNPFYYITLLALIPVKVGDWFYSVLTDVPVVGKFLTIFCIPFYFFLPITRASGFTKKEFTQKGVAKVEEATKRRGRKSVANAGRRVGNKAASKAAGRIATEEGEESGIKFIAKKMPKVIEKLAVRFWDDAISIPAAATVVGGAALTFIDIPFSTGTYNLLELWDKDKKWVKAGGVRRWLVTAFLPKMYDEDGNVLEDFRDKDTQTDSNKWQENGKTVMADGGRDRDNGRNRRNERDVRDWGEINPDNDSSDRSFSMPGRWSILRIGAMSIFGILVLGVGSVVATGGGGPAGVAGDYLGANVDAPEFDGVGFMANKAVKTVSCFGDQGCIREWQINNTRRPGSEDVGETFKLNIRNYNVFAGGGSVDVSNRRADSSIPVSFFLQNTRNGIKGIPARDVQYRVSVRDETLLSSQNFCKTDWINLKTNYGSEDSENVLISGAGVSPVSWEDQLTLRKCGLLQPGAGNYVNFVLEVKYNYSSQSTHYVEVMSRSHMTGQGITPNPDARSETADTPVETYISTRDPVVFEESSGERYSIPFTARVSVNADDSDTRYRIDPEAFRFEDSDITSRVSDSCQGLNRLEGDTFALSDSVKSSIERTQTDQDEWFGDGNPPPIASCDLKIADDELDRVSRTGETLTMTADVNYTLKLSEREESFRIFNNLCGTENCPMLIPLSGDNISAEVINTDLYSANPEKNPNYWAKNYAVCDGNQDAQNGCSVVKSFDVSDRRDPLEDSQNEVITIDEGDIAVELSTADSSLIHCDSERPESGVQSVDLEELEVAISEQDQVLSKTTAGWRARGSCS